MTGASDRLNTALEGRYHVERELGEGGMATVYLAEDLRHDRQVAIKVLRPELAALVGAERFLSEIRTTAGLQHPHILPLHDSGEADGFLFYVMPYVEGQSLREKLDRERQLPVEEAVGLARKVADALQYAHEQGVVHRDIKPANILLSRGNPLVADFGIALAVSEAGGGRITETGLSLGTPHYMSPEQAAGDRTVDRRSDVYALGCVLYEMLAGEPPYGGPTSQAVLARILTGEARPLTEMRKTVPPNVAAAVTRALEKLPADRFDTAEAFAHALGDPNFRWTSRGAIPVESGVEGRRSPWLSGPGALAAMTGVALVGAALGALAAGGLGADSRQSSAAVVRIPFDTTRYGIHRAENFDISPDGTRLLHTRPGDPISVVDLATGEEQALPGTENLATDFGAVFSPDGDEIVTVSRDGGFQRIRLDGGRPLPMGPESAVFLIPHVWTEEYLYYSTTEGAYRWAGEGEPELLLSDGLLQAADFQPLPGEEAVLYTAMAAFTQEAEIRLLDVETGETRGLVSDGIAGTYLPGGYLLWGRFDGSVLAARFDPEGGTLGEPVRLLNDVELDTDFGALRLSVSETGTLVYRTGQAGNDAGVRVVRVDPDGRIRPTSVGGRLLSDPAVSPDGRHLAVARNGRVVVIDLVTGEEITTPSDLLGAIPRWAPDGTRLSFVTLARGGDAEIGAAYVWSPFAGTEPVRLETGYGATLPTGWTPDGSRIVGFVAERVGDQPDIAVMDSESGSAEIYLGAPTPEHGPQVSPDGRWLAYFTGRGPTGDLLLRSFPTPGPALQLGRSGEPPTEFAWDPGGTTIYYQTADSLHAVELDLGSTPRIAARRSLFALGRPEGRLSRAGMAYHPDHGFFMILEPAADTAGQQAEPPRTWLVVNWFEELRTRMEEGR